MSQAVKASHFLTTQRGVATCIWCRSVQSTTLRRKSIGPKNVNQKPLESRIQYSRRLLSQSVESRMFSTPGAADPASSSNSVTNATVNDEETSPKTPADRFIMELKTRSQLKRRLEKVKVQHTGHDKGWVVEVNKGHSTPLDVARHLGRNYVALSACALLDGERVLDMNEPIQSKYGEATMQFMWFKNHADQDPALANKTLWNTCSLLAGAILPDLFNQETKVVPYMPTVELQYTDGAFGYEFELLKKDCSNSEHYVSYDWSANERELAFINRKLNQFVYSRPSLYGMDVSLKTAENIFGRDCVKCRLASITVAHKLKSEARVRLYLCGEDSVEIHPGPILPNVNLIGQIEVTSVYPIGLEGVNGGSMHRIEGVALPTLLKAHHWPWSVLIKGAKEEAIDRQKLDAQYGSLDERFAKFAEFFDYEAASKLSYE